MRNAALVLGVIAGLFAMLVGLFSFGWTEVVHAEPQAGEAFGNFVNPTFVRIVSVLAPILAIAGGAMAISRALWGGIALLVSSALMLAAFGFNVATMFPISMAGLGGILAIAAGQPDTPRAHFQTPGKRSP
ncbi:MAG: hypothetical protein NTX73_03325 [Rhodobacterales bacterium]|jgi:hypothetical protein|nr:hypothetical protein [Rhodobacterales bacterium]